MSCIVVIQLYCLQLCQINYFWIWIWSWTYYQLDPWKLTSVIFQSKYNNFDFVFDFGVYKMTSTLSWLLCVKELTLYVQHVMISIALQYLQCWYKHSGDYHQYIYHGEFVSGMPGSHTDTFGLLDHNHRQTSSKSRALVGHEIVDHPDVVGTSPGGTAPTTSSFSTWNLASWDWAKTTATRDMKH